MKLKVLIPSAEYKSFAGARIRYGRLEPELAKRGVTLELQDIGDFRADSNDSDVLLISKCHDARSLIAAAACNVRGQLVGVDLFDDYFSQTEDSRLVRYRSWLKQLLPSCHFALCSTPAIASVVESFNSAVHIHVMNDPAPAVDFAELADIAAEKFNRARNECTLRLAWFGIGDNPHFKVGLSDLAAQAGVLHRLRNSGIGVELAVLTNARALTADGLEAVAQLPVRTTLGEWTEDEERKLLAESFACFLPVNGQAFSAAKSLNRAITALSAGCQIISAGYALYAPLSDLVYREISAFIDDFSNGSMRLSGSRMTKFATAIENFASASHEAKSLSDFLLSLQRKPSSDVGRLILVHGQNTTDTAHKAVKSAEGLSVASPFCSADFDFDVVFRKGGGRLTMSISEEASKRLLSEARESLRPDRSSSGRKLFFLPDGSDPSPLLLASNNQPWDAPLAVRLATYAPTMTQIRQRLHQAFGPCRVFYSENSPLPFNPAF